MGRLLAFIYGVACYLFFFVTFLYAIGFVGNLVVPKGVDSGAEATLPVSIAFNLAVLTIFALQHSVMARPAFKRAWTKIVPQAIERSTYVLLSSLALALVFWQWRPLGQVIWHVEGVGALALWAMFGLGWATVLTSTFLINHFDLFGLQQVYLNLKKIEPKPHAFVTPLFYKIIRHPIMAGFIIAFWSTPNMTLGHLVFAGVSTAYILVAIQFEERDLIGYLGERYRAYQSQVPMLIPGLKLPRGKDTKSAG